MVTDLAPVDIIVQRAGRLHRHQRGERGKPLLLVYSPFPAGQDAGPDWYSRVFPKAAYVYERPGELCLTARLLEEMGSFIMPGDARGMIEGVYGEESRTQKPPALLAMDDQAYGKLSSDRQFADLCTLDVLSGYHPVTGSGVTGHWSPDERVMTRLNTDSAALRLLAWDGPRLVPLHGEGRSAYEYSQVSVPGNWVKGVPDNDPVLMKALEQARSRMPDRGRWCVCVTVTCTGEGTYEGDVVDEKGRKRIMMYDSKKGAALKEVKARKE
jgi:CRISPR-associated endonuclease/helicase Cas3